LKRSTANIFYGLLLTFVGVAFLMSGLGIPEDTDPSSMFVFCSGILFLVGLPLLIIGIRDKNYYNNQSKRYVEANRIATTMEQSIPKENPMGFDLAPIVVNLIKLNDAEGLYQLLEGADFELRKQAVIGLVKINKPLIDFGKIFYLIQDAKPEIRRIAYTREIMGFNGLVANIAALHDPVLSIRFESLDIINRYHMQEAHEVVKRVATFDPDQQLRTLATSYYQRYISKNMIDEKSLNREPIAVDLTWFSSMCLLEDLQPLIEKISVEEQNFLNMLRPENSPDLKQLPYVIKALNQCREFFSKPIENFPANENLMIDYFFNCRNVAVDALNYLSARYSPRVMTCSGLPFIKYSICSMIMLNKLVFESLNP